MPMSPLTSDESDTSPGYVYPPDFYYVHDVPEKEPKKDEMAIIIVDDEPEKEQDTGIAGPAPSGDHAGPAPSDVHEESLGQPPWRPIPPWRQSTVAERAALVPPPVKRQKSVEAEVTQKSVDMFCCRLKPEAKAAFTALYPRDQRLLLALCVEKLQAGDFIEGGTINAFVCSWAANRAL